MQTYVCNSKQNGDLMQMEDWRIARQVAELKPGENELWQTKHYVEGPD